MTLVVHTGQELPAGTPPVADPEQALAGADVPADIFSEADIPRLAHDIVDSYWRSTAAMRSSRRAEQRNITRGSAVIAAARVRAEVDETMRKAGWDEE